MNFLSNKLTYSTLTDLRFTMRRYIRLVVDNDLNALKLFKCIPIPQTHLASIYEALQMEYIELSNNSEIKAKMSRHDHLNKLRRKRKILIACMALLYLDKRHEVVVELLRKSRMRTDNPIKTVEAEIKVLETKIQELAAMQEKENKGKKEQNKIDLRHYVDTFTMLNKNGYKAHIDMPVLEFISAMTAFKKECEDNEKRINEIKNRRK